MGGEHLQYLGIHLLESADDPLAFYYLPTQLEVTEREDGKALSMTKYIGREQDDPSGALFNMSFTISPPAAKLKRVESYLKRKVAGARLRGLVPLFSEASPGRAVSYLVSHLTDEAEVLAMSHRPVTVENAQTSIGLLSIVYLSGIYSSAQVGALADKLGRRKVLWAVIGLMLAGLVLTLFDVLPVILVGMLLFTFGFFGAHSVSSSWIGRRAKQAKGQASSLYLFCYYLGSSVAGTFGGVFWQAGGWDGLGLFIGSLLLISLAVALHLSRLQALPIAAASR